MSTTSQWWRAVSGSISATAFLPVLGNIANASTETNPRCLTDQAGSALTLKVNLTAAPGVGNSWRCQLSVNGTPSTTLDFTISGASTTGSATGTVSISAGDLLSVKLTASGTPSATVAEAWTEFDPTTANAFCYPGSGGSSSVVNGNAVRAFGSGAVTSVRGTGNSAMVVAIPGQITSLRCLLSAAPGGVTSRTFAVYKNGSELVNTDLTITGASTSGTLSGLTESISAGDYLEFSQKTTSGSPAAANMKWCITYTPTTARQWMAYTCFTGSPNTSSVSYSSAVSNTIQTPDTTEANVQITAPAAATIVGIACRLVTAPGVGHTWTIRNRIGGNNGSLSFTISGAGATSGADNAHTDVIAAGNLIDMSFTPSSPTSTAGFSVAMGFDNQSAITVIPGNASLSLSAKTPSINGGVVPGKASLTTSLKTPSLKLSVVPGTKSIAITAHAPTLKTAIIPGTASLTLTPQAPALKGFVTPGTAHLVLSPKTPLVLGNFHYIPGTAALVTSRKTPTVTVKRTHKPQKLNYLYTGSGLFSLGGAATVSVTRNVTGDGGIVFGGAAEVEVQLPPPLLEFFLTGSGGIIFSGSADPVAIFEFTASGGLILSGAAAVQIYQQIVNPQPVQPVFIIREDHQVLMVVEQLSDRLDVAFLATNRVTIHEHASASIIIREEKSGLPAIRETASANVRVPAT